MFPLGLKKKVRDDRGSISILVVGLFSLLLITSMILTDISSIYIAQRSLSLTTEAALQRGMKNLDKERYYTGEYNLTTMLKNSILGSGNNPGIPIDCEAGRTDVVQLLAGWDEQDYSARRENLESIHLIDFQCDGYQIFIRSAAIAKLPIPIPFTNVSQISLQTHAGGIGERASSNNYSGFDIG